MQMPRRVTGMRPKLSLELGLKRSMELGLNRVMDLGLSNFKGVELGLMDIFLKRCQLTLE